MESISFVAKAETTIKATISKVWDAFVNPVIIKKYMFGTEVSSSWFEGSKIIWKGEWEGKPYEDKGVILKLHPPTTFQFSHFSPLSGLRDSPENYHTVTIQLAEKANGITVVTLTQDNNPTEKEKDESTKNWSMMLESLKKLLERNGL